MAVRIKANGTRGLNFTATLDINQAKRNAQDLKKTLAELGITAANGLDSKGLTGYQQAQIALKQTLVESQKETERLRQDAARYRAELEQGKVAQQAAKTQLEQLNIAEQQLRISFQQGRITQQQYNQQLAAGRIAQQDLNRALVQGKVDQQNLRTEISRLNLARKQELEAQRAARREQQTAAGSYREAQYRLKQLGDQIRSVAGGFQSTSPLMKARIKEYNELNEALKKFDARLGNHQRNVGNYRGAIQSAAQDLLGFASAYLSAGAALTYVFNQTLAFQRIKTPLTYILGSEGEANNKLAELKALADELGVSYFTLANTYRSFTAAARASNFDLGQSEKIFQSVTRASSVLGLSSEQLEGALLAVQQMISKGSVQSEELRGQLGERLPGAFALAAKAMGVTEKELGKLLQSGSVAANELLPKLAKELDKAYGDKAAEGISGLNAELGRFKATMEATAGESSSLSKKIFEPIVRGAREVVKELGQMFRGSFMENVSYFFTFDSASLAAKRKAYDLRDSRVNNENAQKAAEQYSVEGKSVGDLRTKYLQLTETMRAAVKAQETFKKGVEDGTLKETKDGTVANYTAIANGIIAQRRRIGEAYVNLKNQQSKENKEIADSALTSVAAIRKRIAELKKLDDSAVEGSAVFNRIKALEERLKTSNKNVVDSALKSQRTLQAEIDALTKKGQDKKRTADQQEIADVEAKYKKLREKAIAFNNDPKNKAKGLRVDAGGLLRAESSEIDAVRDKQNAEKLKVTIDEQKKLYDEFEKYKSDFGEAKAKERYAKLINVDQTYLENLKSRQEALLGDDKAKGGDAGGGEFVEKQLKVLEEATKDAVQEESKKNDALLKEFMGYTEKRKLMTEQFNHDFAVLEGNSEAQAERKKKYDRELKELDDANATKLSSYEKLFAGIDQLSTRNALRLVQTARTQFAKDIKNGLVISPEQIKQITELFNKTETAIRQKNGQALRDFSVEVNNVASEVGALNEEFGKVLGTVGNVIGKLGEIKGFKDILSKDSSTSLEKLGAGIGIFGAGLNILQSIVGFFSKSEQREAQASYARELQNKQTEALNKALERQVALLENVYGTERIKNYSEAIRQAQENQAKYANDLTTKYVLTGNKEYDDIITKLNNGEKINSILLNRESEVYRNLLKSGELKGLPTNIETLQRLLDEGKLDANTATIVNNLIKAKQTAEELANSLRAETVGASLDTIVDEFMDSLTSGADNFESTLTKSIRRGLLEALKGDLTQRYIQEFYSQLDAALSDGVITSDEDSELKKLYEAAEAYGKKKLDYINSVAPDTSTTSSSSLKGQITGVTEDTGTKIVGAFNGMRLTQLQTNVLLTSQGNTLGDLYLISRDNFAIQQKIEANTRRGADAGESALPLLRKIADNTSDSLAAQLRAGGKFGY